MKTILLIYYNQNHNNFHYRFCYSIDLLISNYYVGYKNSYGHEIISILLITNGKTFPIKNYDDYLRLNKKERENNRKNDLIDKIISLLNKLKK